MLKSNNLFLRSNFGSSILGCCGSRHCEGLRPDHMPTVDVQLSWLHGDHSQIGLESHSKLLLVLQHLCWMQFCSMQTEVQSPTMYRVTK